MIIIIMFTN